MNETVTISAALIFSLVAVASQIFGIWNAQKKNRENDASKSIQIEKNFVELNIKLDYFQKSTDQMLDKQEAHAVRMENLTGQIIKSNERIETLFKYKDDHEKRLKRLEEK